MVNLRLQPCNNPLLRACWLWEDPSSRRFCSSLKKNWSRGDSTLRIVTTEPALFRTYNPTEKIYTWLYSLVYYYVWFILRSITNEVGFATSSQVAWPTYSSTVSYPFNLKQKYLPSGFLKMFCFININNRHIAGVNIHFDRARKLVFYKKHFQWKSLSEYFERCTKAKKWGNIHVGHALRVALMGILQNQVSISQLWYRQIQCLRSQFFKRASTTFMY